MNWRNAVSAWAALSLLLLLILGGAAVASALRPSPHIDWTKLTNPRHDGQPAHRISPEAERTDETW